MLITVRFTNVDHSLHLSIIAKSIITKIKAGRCYNEAMDDFTKLMKQDTTPFNPFSIMPSCKPARVENIDNDIYKEFKVTCIRKDISISQGINLALKNWLDNNK